jgi:hypothetical protein
VAGFFQLLGIHTARSIFAIHAFDCLINSLACIPIFLMPRRSFGAHGVVGGLDMGLSLLWHLLFRGVGPVHIPAAVVGTPLSVPPPGLSSARFAAAAITGSGTRLHLRSVQCRSLGFLHHIPSVRNDIQRPAFALFKNLGYIFSQNADGH